MTAQQLQQKVSEEANGKVAELFKRVFTIRTDKKHACNCQICVLSRRYERVELRLYVGRNGDQHKAIDVLKDIWDRLYKAWREHHLDCKDPNTWSHHEDNLQAEWWLRTF